MKTSTLTLHIDNMNCGGCVKGVTRALQKVEPHITPRITLERKEVELDTHATAQMCIEALEQAGFKAQAVH